MVIKGYFLDKGKVFLNNKELKLRSDGMFIEKVYLPKIGENEFKFVITGTNIDNYEYKYTIIRHYPYLDVSENVQEKWLTLLGKVDGFKSSYFKPAEFVSKKEFYLLLAKIFKFEPGKTFNLEKQFADVTENTPLKNTLISMKSSGILNGDYKNFFPDSYILRQEALVVLSKFLPLVSADNLTIDIKEIPRWMEKDLNKLMYYGIINITNPKVNETLNRYDLYDMLSELITKVTTNVVNNNREKKIVTIKNIAERKSKLPNLMMTLLLKDTSGAVSLDSVQILVPNKDIRVSTEAFTIYGQGVAGTSFLINGKAVVIGKDKKFSKNITLKPGKNILNFNFEKIEKNFTIEYVKEYQDIKGSDYFSDIIKKMMTMGYINSDKYFNGGHSVTKKELYLALKRIGYINMDTFKAIKNPEEKLTYKKMTNIVKELTGETIVYDIKDTDIIRRRLFVLMLYELPLVKKAYQKNFLSVILTNLA